MIRVYQLARELQMGTDELLRLIGEELHIDVSNHMASLNEEVEARLRTLAAARAEGVAARSADTPSAALRAAIEGGQVAPAPARPPAPRPGRPQAGAGPRFVRFHFPGRGPALGLCRENQEGEAGTEVVADLSALDPGRFADPVQWLRRLLRDRTSAAAELAAAAALAPSVATLAELEQSLALLPPVDAPEVWAAGVTYERSRDARDREHVGTGGETPYDRVYAAERPELFFKATGPRVVGGGQAVGLRGDSRWQVPEPELALVLDEDASILGYTLGNDMSCRDIEGENPLYLPQAKIYRCSCALGPTVLAAAPAAPDFPILCAVRRVGTTVWEAETTTAHMRRRFSDLAAHLVRHNWLPAGSVLLTGTGVVPPDDFSLAPGDEIEIRSPAIGSLRNVARPV